MGDTSADSSDSESSRGLQKRLKKLKRRLKKYKRRSRRRVKSRSSSRSSNERQSSRSRSRPRSSSNRSRPAEHSRYYRSSRSYESRRTRRNLTDSNRSVQPNNDPTSRRASPNRAQNQTDNIITDPVAYEDPQVLEIHGNEEIADDWLKMLGDDPQSNKENLLELHPAISSRWSHIIVNGLTQEVRDELGKKYAFPCNCDTLIPPQINAEVLNILPSFHAKRDKSHLDMQTRLCKGMTALGKGISFLLADKGNTPKEHKENLLSCLGDAGRMLADLVHHSSQLRRTLIMPQMSKSAREMAEKTTPGQFLFGTDFGDKIKELKVMEKTSSDLRPPLPSTSKVTTQYKKPQRNAGGRTQRYTSSATRDDLNRGRPARSQRNVRPQKGRPSKSKTSYSWKPR